ncbi:lytic transglycosylase domain-containing protein [Bosea vestrisii]|uniref:lytic transglycosylase domain-containing protein n=1 Tax=Bosea vestrisii TaxID=151416 RepID=UPI0024DFFBB1|nr:lytic transglycosylase domain-containing protein [Bosea vestrisii]WID97793.1 lytic transglycosylase domain-containing protein [Bosea vestrisii]
MPGLSSARFCPGERRDGRPRLHRAGGRNPAPGRRCRAGPGSAEGDSRNRPDEGRAEGAGQGRQDRSRSSHATRGTRRLRGLRALVARHAAANGVPFSLADAVVRIESRYNPRAANAGNFGLMQIRHQTARGVGYSGGAAGLLDADTNARYAMKYLGQAYKLAGGDTCRTVMMYQSGHMATRMSGANRAYCGKVRTITGAAQASN